MTLFRRTLIAATAAAALATPFAASWAQDIKPRLIRFGYGLNEQSNQGRAVKMFAEQVDKASGGKMKVRAIGAAALGPDTQMQQSLIGGAQEMMVGSTATLVGITKEMALWDSPFLISNAKEADALLDGPVGDKIRNKLQDKGLVGLAYSAKYLWAAVVDRLRLPVIGHLGQRRGRLQEGNGVGHLRRFGAQHGLEGIRRETGLFALLELLAGKARVIVGDDGGE